MRCETCGGTGIKLEPRDMVALRLDHDLNQKECARRMGITASYLSDLENGRRDWNASLFEKLKKAVK